MVQGIGAGGQAEGLAHGHPDRGSDLDHGADLGVVDGPPGLADLVIDRDGAGGADGGALSAADAVGLGQGAVEGGGDAHIIAPLGKVDDAHADGLAAHPDAVAAQDALAGVPDHGRAAVVQLGLLPAVHKTHPAHAEAHGQLLKAAVAALLAGGAGAVVRGQQQFQDHPAVLQQPGGVGADGQPIPGLHRAGGLDLAPLVLHHAHPAGPVDGQVGVIAEGGHLDAGLADDRQHVGLPVEGDPLAVDVHDSLCHSAHSSRMAPKGQQPQHAPHLMHFSVSMTWGIRIWPEMASIGHCRIHLPQPLHNSGSMWSSFFRPLQ